MSNSEQNSELPWTVKAPAVFVPLRRAPPLPEGCYVQVDLYDCDVRVLDIPIEEEVK